RVSAISASISASGSSPACACSTASSTNRAAKRRYNSRPSAGLLANASSPSRYQRASTCCAVMDADVAALADAVEAADALLEQVGIERQVPQDDVVGELEIAAFRADFR